jgi:putative hemolysin
MDAYLLIQSIAIVLLLGLSAFFSGSETVLFSLDPLQIRRMKARKIARVESIERLLADTPSLLATLLIGNVIVNVALASVGYSLSKRLLPHYGEGLSIAAVTILLLIFGEIGPKRIGLAHAEFLAPRLARPLIFCRSISLPLRYLLEALTDALHGLFQPHGRHLSDEEYETVLDIGGEEGLLDEEEWGMVKAITRLQDLTAADVMTPRVDLQGIDLDGLPDRAALIETARQAERKMLIAYRGRIDNIVGMLDVRKFLLDPHHAIGPAISKPLFVPEISRLDKVWTQLQQQRQRNAVAVDEYGGLAGLITRGDVLEEITGEIYSDLNKDKPVFEEAGPGAWIVDPHLSLEDLNRKLGLALEADDSDRLSGWMAEQLGHVPRTDDSISAQGCRVVVLQTRKQRMTRALIVKETAQ